MPYIAKPTQKTVGTRAGVMWHLHGSILSTPRTKGAYYRHVVVELEHSISRILGDVK
jgi:hypothetical protein